MGLDDDVFQELQNKETQQFVGGPAPGSGPLGGPLLMPEDPNARQQVGSIYVYVLKIIGFFLLPALSLLSNVFLLPFSFVFSRLFVFARLFSFFLDHFLLYFLPVI